MAVDGNWNITMTTPMGERNATLTLKSSGGTLTGTQGAEGNTGEIFDGTVNGDDVAWKISITNPMPLTLEFTGKVCRRQHVRRNGHRPDGQLPVQGDRGRNVSLAVVPANAGTHTPRPGIVRARWLTAFRSTIEFRWLWVPAFAGTIARER